MKLIWGNPIVSILVVGIFSIIQIALTIVLFVNNLEMSISFVFLICFVAIFNYGWLFVFYIAYTKSKYAYISPKKYRKTIKANEKYLLQCDNLKFVLEKIDNKYKGIDNDKVVEKAIEILQHHL